MLAAGGDDADATGQTGALCFSGHACCHAPWALGLCGLIIEVNERRSGRVRSDVVWPDGWMDHFSYGVPGVGWLSALPTDRSHEGVHGCRKSH